MTVHVEAFIKVCYTRLLRQIKISEPVVTVWEKEKSDMVKTQMWKKWILYYD